MSANRYANAHGVGVCCITQNSHWVENEGHVVVIRAVEPTKELPFLIERIDGECFFAHRLLDGTNTMRFMSAREVWCARRHIRVIDLDKPEEIDMIRVAFETKEAAAMAQAKEAVEKAREADVPVPESVEVSQ